MKRPFYNLMVFCESVMNLLLMTVTVTTRRPRGDDSAIRNLLLTRLDSLGDTVLFSASLAAYREHFRMARIVLLTRDEVSGILQACPFVDEVWTLNARRFRLNIVERWKWWVRLRRGGFDLAVNTVYSNSFSVFDCLIGWSGARRRIAHRCLDPTNERRRVWPYYTELAPTIEEWKFEIDRNFDMLRYLGYQGRVQRNTHVWTRADECREANLRLGRIHGHPHAVICPGNRLKEKVWPVQNYLRVIEKVHESSPMHWFVCGDETEVEVCEYLAEALLTKSIPAVSLAGKTSLGDLVAIIGKAELCIGNDSAPLHIAAATSTPGVGVVGGGHFGRFYPYPDNPLTFAAINRLPCYHCYWSCVLGEMECITRVPIDSVVDAVRRLSRLTSPEKVGATQ